MPFGLGLMTDEEIDVPNVLLKTPLYEPILVVDEFEAAKAIRTFEGAVDAYCPGCKSGATFRGLIDVAATRQMEMDRIPVSPGRLTPTAAFAERLQRSGVPQGARVHSQRAPCSRLLLHRGEWRFTKDRPMAVYG